MGEIAESMINGEFDMYTGEYIGKPCGYPRTAGSSKRKSRPKEVDSYIKSKYSSNPEEMVNSFFVEFLGKDDNMKYGKKCKLISESYFTQFASWIGVKYKDHKK